MESDDSDALLIDAGEDELSLDAEDLREAEAILGSKAEAVPGSTDKLWNTTNAAIIGAYTADTSTTVTSPASPTTSGEQGPVLAPSTEEPRPGDPPSGIRAQAATPPPASTFTFGKAPRPLPAANPPPASTFSGAAFRSLLSLSPTPPQVLWLRPVLADCRPHATSCGGAAGATATRRTLQVRSGYGEALCRGEALGRGR